MYKIIQNNIVVDVIRHPNFIKFLSSGHIAMTDKGSAQGVVGSDDKTVYRFTENASIIKINNEEFNRLYSLLNSGQIICADESALAKAKREKLSALSSTCKNKITSGFSIQLSDGNKYNFKLTTEDQLNLMQIESLLAAGETSFVYHATDKPCKIFTRDDMFKIVQTFRKHTLYHTTYYNTAKQYINNLTDIEAVNMFSYGSDVSSILEDTVLKQILKNGGGGN